MAETGKVIKRENFSDVWLTEYDDTTRTNSTTPEWYYVSSFSFVAKCYVNRATNQFVSSPTLIVTCDCYDWTTKTWNRVFYKNCLRSTYAYEHDTPNMQLKFFHNRDTEKDESSYLNMRDSDISRKTALFRFRLERNTGDTNSASGIHIWIGGIGTLTDEEYTNYVKDRPITSNGQLGSDIDNFVWYGGRTGTAPDEEALSKFNPENTKGTVIKKEYEYNCVPKWI